MSVLMSLGVPTQDAGGKALLSEGRQILPQLWDDVNGYGNRGQPTTGLVCRILLDFVEVAHPHETMLA
ncbi:MAG: hypothetical protein AMS20_08890 [Gemmatimonas sp. SG8_28]|nr:MAG: hypothetical protein AMS20_08890 [Gemmatimonas sp. SG8_28]